MPAWRAYPAFQLLVESARRVQPRFALSPEDLPVLLDLCRQVDGLPLALELAASWADTLSLSDILAEARQSLGFLAGGVARRPRAAPQHPGRVRRLVAAARPGGAGRVLPVVRVPGRLCDGKQPPRWSWGRQPHHAFWRRWSASRSCSTIRRRTATRSMNCCGSTGPRSWPPILRSRPRRETNTASTTVTGWVTRERAVKDAEQPSVWDAIQDDIENVRAACLWAATHGHPGRLVQAVDALGWFYYLGYGNYQQGEITFRRLEEALVASRGMAVIRHGLTAQRTMARILAWQATFRRCAETGRRASA